MFLWVLYDAVALCICVFLSFLVGMNFSLESLSGNISELFGYSLVAIVLGIAVNLLTKRNVTLWRYSSLFDFTLLCVSHVSSTIFLLVYNVFLIIKSNKTCIDARMLFVFALLSVICVVAPIIIIRTVSRYHAVSKSEKRKNIMIIGAGDATRILIEDIANNKSFSSAKVACLIDDDEKKVSKYVHNVKVVGTRDDIVPMAKKYNIDIIIFAISSMDKNKRREILEICSQTGCVLKTMPSIDEAVNEPEQTKVSDVKIEDLLERMPIKLDMSEKMDYVRGKVVIVTGGGGSIGSELCRQIVKYSPKLLIIFDVYENNAYDIQNELLTNHPDANILVLIGSVRDSKRMECIFEKYRPQIVYHAAAHKHVPLMEDSPNEAIKNNVFGTYKTAQVADKYKAQRFVLISTDKAVNPTNIMGASKRLCEMIVQHFSKSSKTEYVAVRFGNVLGSNGSVIPLFKKQIEHGGPVKVTHPDIIRYFMTIPEAVSLVLTAGAMAKGGEIFVLDMGKPVKILDLAKNMIRLMGYKVDEDIMIEFSGLRPGEKLYEEKLMSEEGLEDTENHLIHVAKPISFDDEWFEEKLSLLKEEMYKDDCDIRSLVHEIVPTYKEANNNH